DRVAILQRGEVIRQGDIPSLTRQTGLFVVGLAPGQEFPQWEVEQRGFQVAKNGTFWEVSLADGQTIDPVVDLIRSKGLNLRHLGRSGKPWKTCSCRPSSPPSPALMPRGSPAGGTPKNATRSANGRAPGSPTGTGRLCPR